MIKRIVSVVLFLLLVNAGVRVGFVYFHDQQFKDAVREYALLAGQPPPKADEVVRAKVMDLAQEHQIPLEPDYLEIIRQPVPGVGEKVSVKFAYAVIVPLVPGYPYRIDFSYRTP